MYRLIVIDDEVSSRETICSCFPWEDFGFNVAGQFDCAADALQYLSQTTVDVILCDIVMPEISGIDFVKALVAQSSQMPKIIFLSGYADFNYAKQALSYGIIDYILKPAKYSELIEVFTRLKERLDDEFAFSLNNSSKTDDAINLAVTTVKKYINAQYQTANLLEASKLVYMNPSYLSQLFKKKVGMKFSDYLMQIRMEKGKELLQDLSLKIYNISEMVGYNDPQNFARAFKKYWGESPDYYRGGKRKE